MKLKLFLCCICLVFSTFQTLAQRLEFYREDIRFEIKDHYFYVNGDYYFANVGGDSINTLLFYPFPASSVYGKVDAVSIMLMRDSSRLMQDFSQAGAFFAIHLKPYESSKVNISYRQKLLGNTAEYILLTTEQWKKPFEQVNYSLKLQNKIKVKSISYPSDSNSSTNKEHIYYWHKENFMPDKNFLIEFKDSD